MFQKALRLILALSIATSVLLAEPLPVVPAPQAGLDSARLARIDRQMNAHVEANQLAGGIGLVARNGKIGYFQTYGYMDTASKKPMRKDSIFRIYSMTKAVTAVSVMMLYEEGKFHLNEPIGKYLPEWANMRVAVETKDPVSGKRVAYTVPAERAITIRDLLRHTSGIDYQGPVDEKGAPVYMQLKVQEPGIDLAEASRRLAKAPLLHQPGTTYHYGLSIDVLGRLVEVVSGQPLDQFFEERIFKPLGMVDTAFYVPEAKWDRLVTLYAPKSDGTIDLFKGPPQDSYKKKPSAFMGGQGLASTALDYARFCQMLLDGGKLEGKRLLGRKTVELMASDHLGEMPRVAAMGAVPKGFGFGLTFAVNQGPGKTGAIGSEGEFSWGGAAGTKFWIDPKENLFAVFMMNTLPPQIDIGSEFKQLVYQALE
jgi:CubicO group peptidase (beta-lactamase class C family)